MNVVVAGSRDLTDYGLVSEIILASELNIGTIISGCCRGVDALGERWAKERGIPVNPFPADWKQYGLGAGHRRNEEMAERADAAIVVLWKTRSRGSEDMIRCMEAYPGKPLIVFRIPRSRGSSGPRSAAPDSTPSTA